MDKQQAIEIAKQFFPFYPGVDAFHITADGQAFENIEQAEAHGEAVTVTRDEVSE